MFAAAHSCSADLRHFRLGFGRFARGDTLLEVGDNRVDFFLIARIGRARDFGDSAHLGFIASGDRGIYHGAHGFGQFGMGRLRCHECDKRYQLQS